MQERRFAGDPRVVYWIYAVAAWVGGVFLAGWGPLWLGLDLPGRPFGLAALIRLYGAFVAGGGFFAACLAMMDDPVARRRARGWFLAANVGVFITFVVQQHAVLGGGAAETGAKILFVVVILGVLIGAEEPGAAERADMITLFGTTRRPPTLGQLRSRYEQQVREAGRQEERNRLARELHDSIKQQLFVIQTAAATAQARWEQDPGGAGTAVEQIRSSARDAMAEMEVMLAQLRAAPLEKIGLTEALKKQAEALALRTGAKVTFEGSGAPAPSRLAAGAYQAIFRVAQEAMANVARHARAGNVRVALDTTNGDVRLLVEDDGAGFDVRRTQHELGLSSMRERAEEFGGDLSVRSCPGRGTTIQLVMPCLPPDLETYRLQVRIWAVMLVCQVALGLWIREILVYAVIPAGFLTRSLLGLRARQRPRGALR